MFLKSIIFCIFIANNTVLTTTQLSKEVASLVKIIVMAQILANHFVHAKREGKGKIKKMHTEFHSFSNGMNYFSNPDCNLRL